MQQSAGIGTAWLCSQACSQYKASKRERCPVAIGPTAAVVLAKPGLGTPLLLLTCQATGNWPEGPRQKVASETPLVNEEIWSTHQVLVHGSRPTQVSLQDRDRRWKQLEIDDG